MVRIAGVQFVGNADKESTSRSADPDGARGGGAGRPIVCLPELFSTMYFCVETSREYFDWAEPIPGPTIERMGALARETGHRPDRADLRARAGRALLQHRGRASAPTAG